MITRMRRHEGYEDKLKKQLLLLPEDCVLIVLWDILLGNIEKLAFLRELKCFKRLVLWNHDKLSKTKYHELFHSVVDELTLRYMGKKIVLSHKPIFNRDDFDYNVHWHFHNNDLTYCMDLEFKENTYTDKHKLYSPEKQNYIPVDLQSIVYKDNSQLVTWWKQYKSFNL